MNGMQYLLPVVMVFAGFAGAESLGDAVARQNNAPAYRETVIGSAKVSGVLYNINKVTLSKKLYLPDALNPKMISPTDGRLVVIIQGKAVNEGAEKASYEIPRLVAGNGGKNEPADKLYCKRAGKTSLNPMECYPFVLCFLVSPDLLQGSGLLVSDGDWMEPQTAMIPLSFTNSTTVEESVTLPDVTDNMFDVEDVPNAVEPSAASKVQEAKKQAEADAARKQAEKEAAELRTRMLEWELDSKMRQLESEARSLEAELNRLERECD
ncbi:MAG: hypothetical protein Q4C88_09055 [Akkermansia sp.]|nr:hypothetical protein [Akkermansia sp.]